MGLSRPILRFLVRQHRERPLRGAVLTLGRQHVDATWGEVRAMMRAEGVETPSGPESGRLGDGMGRAAKSADGAPMNDASFFRMLGASEVSALDVSDYEGAEIVHDLNRPVPENLAERFDVVVDSGTLEHVFDVRQALTNICRMLKPGGIVFHFSPTSNYVDHGYYQFSPRLLLDYYGANGFARCQAWLVEHSRVFRSAGWVLYAYEPGRSIAPFGAIRSTRSWATFARAEKTDGSTDSAIPMQVFGGAHGQGSAPSWARHARGIVAALRKHPLLWRIVGGAGLMMWGAIRRRPVNARRIATLR